MDTNPNTETSVAVAEKPAGPPAPPPARGRSVKVRYATQARVAPPEVVLFTTGQLTPSYRRYLEKDLRRTFGFQGTPVRLVVRVRTRERAADG